MRPLLRHRLRQGVERNIIRAIKRVDPIYDHFLRELRYPLLPKIVVYTIIPKEDYTSFFDKHAMHYSYVSPGVHEKELDAEVTKKLTLDMAKPEEVKTQKDMKKLHGYFIMNFPKTPQQALLLDHDLNGINLAIYLRGNSEPLRKKFQSQYNPVFNYYQNTGAMITMDYADQMTTEDHFKAERQMIAKMKMNPF